jgi:transcription termination factor Rho
VAAEALEKSVLESKDKEQLFAIAQALGIKTTARAAKATLIDKILESTGHSPSAPAAAAPAVPAADASDAPAPAPPVDAPPVAASTESADAGVADDGDDADADGDGDGDDDGDPGDADGRHDGQGDEGESRSRRRRRRRKGRSGDAEGGQSSGAPGAGAPAPAAANGQSSHAPAAAAAAGSSSAGSSSGGSSGSSQTFPQRGPRPDRPDRSDRWDRDASDDSAHQEPVKVAGYLDLREEGYGFLRLAGYLPTRDDAYIPVKLTRQYGLRKGDHVTGLSRPAGRNEKNPALLEIHTVNGAEPDAARQRPRFDDLTAVSPDTWLQLDDPAGTTDPVVRALDLVAPIGRGQRGLLVTPPRSGKTALLAGLAAAIEQRHPDVALLVVLIDERPEEVTAMRRRTGAEVIASTFDRPSEEHVHVAELVVERAKRMVEAGRDVVVLLDGITRLTRAFHLAQPAGGRQLAGGLDAGALLPAKRLLGAARNTEEAGSLTILATALADTGSVFDDAVLDELIGTVNMQLRLDRGLAERRISPAVDVEGSGTRHEELLVDSARRDQLARLRRALVDGAATGSATAGELLAARLAASRTNAELLAAATSGRGA